MLNLFVYLAKVHVAIALMYLIYRLLLSRNVTLLVKRVYLLASLPLAFIFPFVHIPKLNNNHMSELRNAIDFNYFDTLSKIQFLQTNHEIGSADDFDFFSIILIIYLIISILLFIFVVRSLLKIIISIRTNQQIRKGKICYIINEKYSNPFSFFKYLFTNKENDFEKTPEYLHELAHIQQLHSIDRLLVELLVPMLWINPFIYLFKKSLIEVHEHLADHAVLQAGIEPIDYQNYLYLQLKSGQYLKMTSNFNYSLTKKRITMISKNISKKKSIVRTFITLVLISGISIFYGFNNAKMLDPDAGLRVNYANMDISDPVPSILPLKSGGDYYIGSHYGMRKHPITGKMEKHVGIDIVADTGTEIIAPADGEIIEAKYLGKYGNLIKIKHTNGLETIYAHLSAFNVKIGDKVKTNDVIGYVGSTGLSTRAHLHYEVRKYPENKPITYYNPADYINNIKEIPEREKSK